MVNVYLSTRGDINFLCGKCPHTMIIPAEFQDTPFFDHYNGIIIHKMIQHYLDAHSRAITRQETAPWETIPTGNGRPNAAPIR